MDCFSKLKKIKLCTHYEIDGVKTDNYPCELDRLERAKPIYEEMDGWCCDISKVTKYEDLPENAKKYAKRMQELVGVPMSILSIGPKRSQTIVLRKDLLF